MHPTLTRIIFLLFALPALGQTSSAVAVPLLRAAELTIYPPIAKAARMTGKVVVRYGCYVDPMKDIMPCVVRASGEPDAEA